MKLFRVSVVWSFVLFLLVLGPALAAQAVEAVTGIATAPPSAADEWGNSFLWAIASSWGMRWLRENPKVSKFSERSVLATQRAVAAAIAFVNGLGITFAFDKQEGTLLIGGLFLTAVLHGLRQFLLQELVYQSSFKRTTAQAQLSQ